MSKGKGNNPPVNGGGAVQELSRTCVAEDCDKKRQRAQFCEKHFLWFKEGLLTKDGQRPKDFDKKHMDLLKRNPDAA